MGRATLWAFFSQTHLVTLVAIVTPVLFNFGQVCDNYRSSPIFGANFNF
jgi:hypothetical protein